MTNSTAFLTCKDVASALQITRQMVSLLIQHGQLRAVRINSRRAKAPRYRIPVAAFARYRREYHLCPDDLTVKAAAALLGMPTPRLHWLVKHGHVPAHRHGWHWALRVADLTPRPLPARGRPPLVFPR